MTTILLFHIASAFLLTISAVATLLVAIMRVRRDSLVSFSRISFGSTLLSGVVLVVISPQSLTHVCVMMTVYAFAIFGVEAFYKKRTEKSLLPQETTV